MTNGSTDGSPVPPLFSLGEFRVDNDVHDQVAMHRLSLEPFFRRYCQADWGDVTPELAGRNSRVVLLGWWIKGLYRLPDSIDVIGIRTNAQRTETHVRVEWDPPQDLEL